MEKSDTDQNAIANGVHIITVRETNELSDRNISIEVERNSYNVNDQGTANDGMLPHPSGGIKSQNRPDDVNKAPYSSDAMLKPGNFKEEFIKNSRENMYTKYLVMYTIIEDGSKWKFKDSFDGPKLKNFSHSYTNAIEQSFRCILCYAGDKSTSKNPIVYATKLLEIGKNNPAEVRDEIFLQLLRQTREHPKKSGRLRMWKLIAVVVSAYPPSADLFWPLCNYIYSLLEREVDDPEVSFFTMFIFARLHFFYYRGNRKEIPSEVEIQFIEERRRILIPVYLADGTFLPIHVESYTTAKEAKALVFDQLKLPFEKDVVYHFQEVCEKTTQTEERYIENDDMLADLLSVWAKEEKLYEKDKPKFCLYFRLRIYYPYKEYDQAAVRFYYMQLKYDVLHDRIPFDEKEAIHVAGLMFQADFPNWNGDITMLADKNLKEYFPEQIWLSYPESIWKKKLSMAHSSFKDTKGEKAKLEIHNLLIRNPYTLAECYFVEFSSRNETNDYWEKWPTDLLLALKPLELFICNAETKEILMPVPYKRIMSWGGSTEFFVLVIGDMNYQDKFYFGTTQAKLIIFTLQAYTSLAMCKKIPENVTLVQRSLKRGEDSTVIHTRKVEFRNATVFRKPKKAANVTRASQN